MTALKKILTFARLSHIPRCSPRKVDFRLKSNLPAPWKVKQASLYIVEVSADGTS